MTQFVITCVVDCVTCCIVCNICRSDYQVDIVDEADRFRFTRIYSDSSDSELDPIEELQVEDFSFEEWANDER